MRYVVIHNDVYRTMGRRPPVPNSGLTFPARFGSVRIYSVPKLGGNIRTILRANQLLIAKRQELQSPKITVCEGLRLAPSHKGSVARQLAARGELNVKQATS